MTPAERTAAFNAERRRQLRQLSRLQRDGVGEIERQLREAARHIERLLAAAGSEWRRAQLRAMQAEIQQALELWRTQAVEAAAGSLQRGWQAGTELVTQPLAAAGARIPPPRLNLGALAALESGLTAKITGIGTAALNRINAQIAQVLIGARPASEAITVVQRLLGGSVRQRARGIVYDEVGRAYSMASQNSLAHAAELLPGLRKQWLHSGKRSARPEHVAVHGVIVPVNDPYQVDGEALMYPRDPAGRPGNVINCGCLSVPVTDGSTWTDIDELGRITGTGVVRMDALDGESGYRIELPG